MVKIVVSVCLLVEIVIILFHGTAFFEAAVFLLPFQWLFAIGIKEDSEGASNIGIIASIIVFIIDLICLKSSDRAMFIIFAGLNMFAVIVWAACCCEEMNTPCCCSTSQATSKGGNEIWEVKKVRRIGKTK